MNTLNKYVQAIVDATGINGETLGAVKLGIQLALNDDLFAQTMLRADLEYFQRMVGEQATTVARLQGLEDSLLAWLDEHGKDLPTMLPEDYDQRLADVIVEVLNQQRVTIRTQHEALEAQKQAMSRLRQPPAPAISVTLDQTDYGALAKRVVHHMNGSSVSAASTGNPNGTDITLSDPSVPADWTHGQALYVELHRLAKDGVGPSKPRWNIERASGMPLADEITAKTSQRWFALLKLAGLKAPIQSSAVADEGEGTPADGDATFRA